MAELADAADSKSADLRVLGVRLPLPAPLLLSSITCSFPQRFPKLLLYLSIVANRNATNGNSLIRAVGCGRGRVSNRWFLGKPAPRSEIDWFRFHRLFDAGGLILDETRPFHSEPQPMKISPIGVRRSFPGQLDEICPRSVSGLRAL